ncbi:Hypothetical protein NTJ_04681 [Nesidiocoris tenuis]|uniref:Uncharacterized protein n=1 Tax=Nesidiocoris tenuis TaxID=355587 RepID=A0ABN7AHY2_9HEMI|nr:Hypothetical protein NTJ_04681 [Nesidiocoris tenuis]
MGAIKYFSGILLVVLAAKHGEGTVANFLADRAQIRIQDWISSEGSDWITMPGFKTHALNSTEDGYYTLASTGPQYLRIDGISRVGDAEMEPNVSDYPLPINNQNLTFQLAIRNLTVNYAHMKFADYQGLQQITAQVTTDALKVNLTISITGSGPKCVASVDDATVEYEGRKEITQRSYYPQYYQVLDEAITSNFEENIKQALEVLMYAAAVSEFDNYDICQDNTISHATYLQLKNLGTKNLSHN